MLFGGVESVESSREDVLTDAFIRLSKEIQNPTGSNF